MLMQRRSQLRGLVRSQGVCSVSESCLTLCDPLDCAPPGSSVHGILQARILEWVAMPSSRGASQPGDPAQVSLHCRQILYHLNQLWSHVERKKEWLACMKMTVCGEMMTIHTEFKLRGEVAKNTVYLGSNPSLATYGLPDLSMTQFPQL